MRELSKPIIFKGAHEMPYCTVSSADMRWNNTGTWRYLRPRYVAQIPACQASCPAGEPIERWIAHLETGNFIKAWETLTMENPFPGLMGRVCFHPCERGCNRKDVGGAVTINMLEKYLADKAGYELPAIKPWAEKSGKKLAVMGSGPAGLAFAYFSARLGHSVTVYERFPKPGGLFRYGIPEYRLPKEILDKELKKLYDMGIEFQCGKELDKNDIAKLSEKYSAIFIAVGAHVSRPLGVEGENVEGVMPALEFLENVQFEAETGHRTGTIDTLPFVRGGSGWGRSTSPNPSLQRRGISVAVIGGGNSAIDAARMAKRLGGKDVTIIYRRSRAEMPAFEDEVIDAEKEGVKFEMLSAPNRVISENGRVTAVECLRMKLGAADESGRRAPVPINGSEFTIKADLVLAAIGESVDETIIGRPTSVGTFSPAKEGHPNLFFGGDFAGETRTVVNAIGSGKLGAIKIDCMLNGKNFEEVFERIKIPGTNYIKMSSYLDTYALTHLRTAVSTVARTENLNLNYFDENSHPDKNGDPKTELARCMHCGHCIDCDNCYIFCPDVAISKKLKTGQTTDEKYNYEIDHNFCKGCGVCPKECPRAALEMVEEPI